MAEVITGEAVALELPAAGFAGRIAARLIDMAVQVPVLILLLVIVGSWHPASIGYFAAELVTVNVIVLVAYPTVFETLSRGKTLGKLALGVRVVGDDGSPVRFRQALVRALAGLIEIWFLAPIALLCAIISHRGKRVGDYFAGTYVVQERTPARPLLPAAFTVVPPELAGWAQSAQVAGLSEHTAEAAGSYLRRLPELTQAAREALGVRLATSVAAQVSPPPPPGTAPVAYLAAVLAVRRQQQLARLRPPPATSPAGPEQRPLASSLTPAEPRPGQAGEPTAAPFPVSEPPATSAGFVPPA